MSMPPPVEYGNLLVVEVCDVQEVEWERRKGRCEWVCEDSGRFWVPWRGRTKCPVLRRTTTHQQQDARYNRHNAAT